MDSFSLSWYCLLEQLPSHNTSRADFPGTPHHRYQGTSLYISFPPSQSRNTALTQKIPYGLKPSMFHLPNKQVEGPNAKRNITQQSQLKQLQVRVRQRGQVILSMLSQRLCQEPSREGRMPFGTTAAQKQKASPSLPPHWCGSHALTLRDAQGAWGLHDGAP